MSVENEWKLSSEVRARLQNRMEALGIDLSHLADQVAMHRPTVKKIIEGEGDAGVTRMSAICRALGLSLDYVMSGAEMPDSVLPVALWGDDDASTVHFPRSWLRDDEDISSLRLWRVPDDEMAPGIVRRDWVLVDTSRTSPLDGIYLMNAVDRFGERRNMVRRLSVFDQLLAVRATQKYAEETRFEYDQLGKDDGLILLGRVVWSGREIG